MGTGTVLFGQLYTGETPTKHLPLVGLQMIATDLPIHKTPPSLSEVKEAEEVEGWKGS